nr:DUF3109 family protein [Bacteroidota bacterium]
EWPICKPALIHGRRLGLPMYKFLKEPLMRKYGASWYNDLVKEIVKKGK